MKMKTLAVLAGMATPLIVTGSASAGFIGIKTTSKPNDYGLLIGIRWRWRCRWD